jgi:anaerobic selenocysteine-containing dehydrogenase
MIKEGLYDKKFVEERTENFDIMASVIEDYTPEKVEQITGVPAEDIIKAARLFASEEKVLFTMLWVLHSTVTALIMS